MADGYYAMPAAAEPLLAEKASSLKPVAYGTRKTIALIGVLFGVCAAVVFGGAQKEFLNPWAAALGAASGVVALVTYFEHKRRAAAERDGVVVASHTTLLRLFAILGGCVGVAGFLGFLASGVYEKEKVTGRSSYVAAVWGFLLAKWGVLLLLYTNGYAKRDEAMADAMPAPAAPSQNQYDDGKGMLFAAKARAGR
eukprot:CAMPEP_0182925790 /NCGR_PEP_ID=MMETSP0105_2-20130417/10604_1 /TAXON_ID=81532 ORGANISM="Acanthoeca-like sp., Strain 10tr" /NCGR_SAMPLE_ID=MMETSP0105_2 /ASSEMBLY_ACC=CAM_ASM_000205 /LENGTH=195 /DNA_ID=CAMNT_0025063649 /DNA_START=37 /DNA_END=621 /DNA_ORIENTATION=-